MNIAVPKEIVEGERRVAITPDTAKRMVGEGHAVRVESGAGVEAGFPDDAYSEAGAEVVADVASLWSGADVVLKIQAPLEGEMRYVKPDAPLVGLFLPLSDQAAVRRFVEARATTFSLDQLPRITRAQSMDVLSSMSTVAGYKAVLIAASASGKFFPMLVTAAGTIAPSKVLILGAGVAGLQAIATARRLGAVVTAFDVRAAAKEQVESLGARFIEDTGPTEDAEDAGGYAKELSTDQQAKNLQLIHKHIAEVDVVITTALIPGRPAPELITAEMVRDMRAGAVIVDLASEMGGNCALTKPGETVVEDGVTIIGPLNLAASMPTHASQMYAKNLATFMKHVTEDGALKLDYDDEITGATCITRDGEIVHERTRAAMGGNG